MMRASPPRLAVFDLDGTLVETAPDLHAVLVEVMAADGAAPPALDAVRAMIGDGARALLERAYAAAGEALAADRLDRLYAAFLERYTEEPCRHSSAYSGVEAALDELAADGWALAVCTNKPQRPSELLLDRLGLAGRFALIVGGDRLAVRKPDPRHLQHVLERIGAPSSGSVMVGDSRNDLLTARAAGVPCVLVSFGYTSVPASALGADRVVDRFADVPAAVRALTAPARLTLPPLRPYLRASGRLAQR